MLRIINTIQLEDGVKLNYLQRHYVWFIVFHLKRIGVWDKIKALYGFVGGTAATHRWNWKDMRDLDEAYRLSFLGGGWVHDVTGAKPNGTTSYANTFLIPRESLNLYDTNLCFYTPDNIYSENGVEIGVWQNNSEGNNNSITLCSNISSLFLSSAYDQSTARIFPCNTANQPTLIMQNINQQDLTTLYVNSEIIAEINTTSGNLANLSFYISDFHLEEPIIGAASYKSNKEIGFVSISGGLTDFESVQMSRIVMSAQSILGRQ